MGRKREILPEEFSRQVLLEWKEKAWVACDDDGMLHLFTKKPKRLIHQWTCSVYGKGYIIDDWERQKLGVPKLWWKSDPFEIEIDFIAQQHFPT